MTIEQIQAAIDAKADSRQIINMIADYIQANPGGGGATLYSGDGALLDNRTIEFNGKTLSFQNDGKELLGFSIFETNLFSKNTNGDEAQLSLTSDTDGNNVLFYLTADFGPTEVEIRGDAIENTLFYIAGKHNFSGVTEFADNAAAVTGGLAVGTHYRTGDFLKIVH